MSYYRQGPFRTGRPWGGLGAPSLTGYVRLIMIACGGVWILELLAGLAGLDLVGFFGVVPEWVVRRGFLWQPLTYMFLHHPRDPFHILFNMLMLWMFGGELERFWGSRAFLRFYLVCGIGAGLAAVAFGLYFAGMSRVPVIGASGAIFGLFMAYGMIFAERTVLFMLIFPIKARTMAWIMFAVTFFFTWTQPYSGVSHVSHLAGAVVGYLYLKRAWRVGQFYRELKWKIRRRRFKVIPPGGEDRDSWLN